jgi:hypothetical protein
MAVRLWFGLLALIGSTIGSTRVASAEPGFAWQAPATCPGVDDVRARIQARLPDDVTIRGIEVAVTREAGRFIAHIDMSAVTVGNQHRTLTSARCDELADAVAVIVARLAAEAQRQYVAPVAMVTVASPPDPLAAEQPERRVNALAQQSTARSRPDAGKWGGGLRALAVSGIGMVPRVGVGGEAAGFVRRHERFAELALVRWGAQPMYAAQGAPGRVDVGLQTLALRGGWASQDMPLRAWLGLELGSMHGAGVALGDSQAGASRWTAIAAGFGVGWPMSRWSRLVGTFEVAGTVQRSRFALADNTELYQPAAASARCSLGLELGWP